MIRQPTPAELRLFRRWAKRIGRYDGFPTSMLRADDMQELAVQGTVRTLIFSPARLREILEAKQ